MATSGEGDVSIAKVVESADRNYQQNTQTLNTYTAKHECKVLRKEPNNLHLPEHT